MNVRKRPYTVVISELLETNYWKLDINEVVVKTGSGGLHIDYNKLFSTLTSNRMITCYTSRNIDVDIYLAVIIRPNDQLQYCHAQE